MDKNCIVTKFELSDKEKAIKANVFNPSSNTNNNPPKNPNEYQNPFTSSMHYLDQSNLSNQSNNQTDLLQQTKNTLKYLSTLKKQQNEDEETSIKQLLSPLYESITQLHQDIRRMNQLSKKSSNLKPKDIHSLHLEMNQNKNRIKQSLDYVEENDGVFHDEAIVAAIEELKTELENMNKELMEIQDDFEEQFSVIIKEQEREKIAERLMQGGLSHDSSGFFSNQQVNIAKKYLDNNVNYSDYYNDILDIGYEQNKLYNDYKTKVYNLPKLVKPEDKVFFKQQDNTFNNPMMNKTNTNTTSTNKQMKSRGGMKTSGSKSQLDTAVDSTKIDKSSKDTTMMNPMKSNESKQGNYKANIYISDSTNQKIDDDNQSNQQFQQKRDISVIDQMNLFQNKMSTARNNIEVKQSKLPVPRKIIVTGHIPIGNELEPRSSKCKKSYQRFKKPNIPPVYEYIQEQKKPYRYKKDRYPYDPYMNYNQYRGKPLVGKDGLPIISFPSDLPEDKMRDIISKIIQMNIREKLGNKLGNVPQSKIDLQYQNMAQSPQGMDDLIKLLIQKFGDLENALREGRGGGGGRQGDNLDDLAQRITDKIKADMQINVNFDENYNDTYYYNDAEQQQQQPQDDGNFNIEHESFILNKNQSRVYPQEVSKEEESLNPFDTNRRVKHDELDDLIKIPHLINLGDYDVSSASSVFTDSKHISKEEKKMEEVDESNSLSRGQIVTDTEEEVEDNPRHPIQPKTKTPLDLLLLKNMNENLSTHVMANQLYGNRQYKDKNESDSKQSEYEGNEYDEEESFPSLNQKEVVQIDDNKRLKMLQLYNSNEYNQFKQNYPRQGTSSTLQMIPSTQINNNPQLRLIPNTQNDINSLMQKQSLLTEKFKQLAMKTDVINKSVENQKERKGYQTDESSEVI